MKIAVLIALAGCASANAQVWTEVGDAGQNSVADAQVTAGVGGVTTITGSLSNNNDVDLYAIIIRDLSLFRTGVTAFGIGDSQLFLFNMNGTLQVWNNDFGGVLSEITNQGVFSGGHYILGISSFANRPVNSSALDVSTFTTWPGPDAQQRRGNGRILAGWNNNGVDSGNYEITLGGCDFCIPIPAPGAAALLGLSGLVASRRRRAANA